MYMAHDPHNSYPKAKIFTTNRSQAIRLPKQFRFTVQEVYLRRDGENLVISPRPLDWSYLLDNDLVAEAGFMADVNDPEPEDFEL